jgi:four helix bundle protein
MKKFFTLAQTKNKNMKTNAYLPEESPRNAAEHLYSFEKLSAWRLSREFTREIYALTMSFPGFERFGICSQIQRAAVSVTANLAEGSSRTSQRDKARFTQIAYGSLMEVLSLLYVAFDLNYITEQTLMKSKARASEIGYRMTALYKSQLNK